MERKHGAWEWRVCLGLVGSVRDVAEKQASGNMGCEGTYRVLSEVVRRERIRVMLTGSKEAAD